MKPFFSVIIPYHNSGGTIGRLLTSIQGSKKAPPFEVIVVDDGSKEPVIPGSFQDKQGRNDKILRLPKNMGPAVARNRGVKVARGKFVVFADSDVEFFPDTLHQKKCIPASGWV